MPDGGFTVDPAWLDRLATDMRAGTDVLEAALDALEETGPVRTGHKDLDKACDRFHDNWNHALGFMRTDIDHVAEAVGAARANYTAAEAAAQQAYTPPGAQPSGPPAPAAGPAADLSHITAALDPQP